jgi:hypothetical protein
MHSIYFGFFPFASCHLATIIQICGRQRDTRLAPARGCMQDISRLFIYDPKCPVNLFFDRKSYQYGDHTNDDNSGVGCSTHERHKKCIENFDRNTRREETALLRDRRILSHSSRVIYSLTHEARCSHKNT